MDNATVSSDVPVNIAELIQQRRRWINGDFWASFQELLRLREIQWWKIGLISRILLGVAFLYQALDLLVKWFAIVRRLPKFFNV